MKKLKKLFAALLALAMLLSLTVPALAGTLADPRECPYCGNGTYTVTPPHTYSRRIVNTIPCQHGWSGYQDGMLQEIRVIERCCTYSKCEYYPYKPEFIYI